MVLLLANQSYKHGKTAKSWKNAQITIIPKKNNNLSDPSTYRPISVTCFGKLVERLIKMRVEDFPTANKILIKKQSGLRSSRRTTDNLIFLTQKVRESFNRGKKV